MNLKLQLLLLAILSLCTSCAFMSMKVEIYNGDVKANSTELSSNIPSAIRETSKYLVEQKATAAVVLAIQGQLYELMNFPVEHTNDLRIGADQYYYRLDSLKSALLSIDCVRTILKDSILNDMCELKDNLLNIFEVSQPKEEISIFENAMHNFLEDTPTWRQENISSLTDKQLPDSLLTIFQDSIQHAIQQLILVNETAKHLLGSVSNLTRSNIARSLANLENDMSDFKSESNTRLYNLVRNLEIRSHIMSKAQDYGDNIWRKITKPEDRNWQTVFGTTRWRAQGRSGVIIAKDSPVNFRVTQGENDPKAIIKSQLVIARSVSDIALAFTGMPSLNDGSSTGSITTNIPQTEQTMAITSQFLNVKGNQILTELNVRLNAYLERIKITPNDITIKTELSNSLKSYRDMLKSLVTPGVTPTSSTIQE